MDQNNQSSKSDYKSCFACGEENVRGLKLKIEDRDGNAVASFVPDASLEGYEGILHGGMISTVLDEVMAWAARYTTGSFAVTAELKVRFLKPVETGKSYLAEGKILGSKGRIVLAEASLADEAGVVRARAEGKLFKVETPGRS
jgi:uncharacterized protein (TIGR00369 family)